MMTNTQIETPSTINVGVINKKVASSNNYLGRIFKVCKKLAHLLPHQCPTRRTRLRPHDIKH